MLRAVGFGSFLGPGAGEVPGRVVVKTMLVRVELSIVPASSHALPGERVLELEHSDINGLADDTSGLPDTSE